MSLYEHAMLVWTHGDMLRPSEGGMDGFIQGAGDAVAAFLDDVKGGTVTVTNCDDALGGGTIYDDAPPGCRQDHDRLAKAAANAPALSKDALASVLRCVEGIATRHERLRPPPKRRKQARRERQALRIAAEQAAEAEAAKAHADGGGGGGSYWSPAAWYRWAFEPEPEPQAATEAIEDAGDGAADRVL